MHANALTANHSVDLGDQEVDSDGEEAEEWEEEDEFDDEDAERLEEIAQIEEDAAIRPTEAIQFKHLCHLEASSIVVPTPRVQYQAELDAGQLDTEIAQRKDFHEHKIRAAECEDQGEDEDESEDDEEAHEEECDRMEKLAKLVAEPAPRLPFYITRRPAPVLVPERKVVLTRERRAASDGDNNWETDSDEEPSSNEEVTRLALEEVARNAQLQRCRLPPKAFLVEDTEPPLVNNNTLVQWQYEYDRAPTTDGEDDYWDATRILTEGLQGAANLVTSIFWVFN
jgi:hypothetical protein